MLCAFPLRRGETAFPCGQCMPCRINHKRSWVSRLLLEQLCYEESWFITLTYSEAPPGGLRKEDVQKALKRIRQDVSVRYFAVGEYGTRTQRPHYHLVVFGKLSPFLRVNKRGHLEFSRPGWWPFGWVTIGELTRERASYVAHYTTKKWTKGSDRLPPDLAPEFALYSKVPGLGVPALSYLARAFASKTGREALERAGDVPRTFRLDSRVWPLPRGLREQLRALVGVPLDPMERPPILRSESMIFRLASRTDEEECKAIALHERARRKAASHGSV